MNVRAAVAAGIVASAVSTLVQVVLWIAFTDTFPGVLERDARLAAAIVLGPRVLDGGSDYAVWSVATVVHVVLSIVYALALAAVVSRLPRSASLMTGAAFGALLYAVNLHGFTAVFPWFVVSRDAITFAAHVAFGVCVAIAYEAIGRRRDDVSSRNPSL